MVRLSWAIGYVSFVGSPSRCSHDVVCISCSRMMIVMTAAPARAAVKEAAREAEKEAPPRVTVAAVVKAARAARAGVNEHLRRSFCETDQIGHSLVLVVK